MKNETLQLLKQKACGQKMFCVRFLDSIYRPEPGKVPYVPLLRVAHTILWQLGIYVIARHVKALFMIQWREVLYLRKQSAWLIQNDNNIIEQLLVKGTWQIQLLVKGTWQKHLLCKYLSIYLTESKWPNKSITRDVFVDTSSIIG